MDSALQPLAQAVFGALNVSSLLDPPPAGAGGHKLTDKNPTTAGDTTFPFVWYELFTEDKGGGLGPGPWLHIIDLRVHVYSTANGMAEPQRILREVVHLLRAIKLTVPGWRNWYTAHDRDVSLPYEEVNGLKCTELVAMFRVFVEEASAVA